MSERNSSKKFREKFLIFFITFFKVLFKDCFVCQSNSLMFDFKVTNLASERFHCTTTMILNLFSWLITTGIACKYPSRCGFLRNLLDKRKTINFVRKEWWSNFNSVFVTPRPAKGVF